MEAQGMVFAMHQGENSTLKGMLRRLCAEQLLLASCSRRRRCAKGTRDDGSPAS
jgi:hypothetical protein